MALLQLKKCSTLRRLGASARQIPRLYGRLATLGNTAVKRKSEEIRAEFSRGIAEELGG